MAKMLGQPMLVPFQGAAVRSHSENQGEGHPCEGPQGNSRWRGRKKHHIYGGSNKKDKKA